LVSEEAHYADAKKILSGLAEAVPMDGYLIRESTPLGDSGYFYESVQDCINGESVYKLIPFWWWDGDDYLLPRGSELVPEEERGKLLYSPEEAELVLSKGLSEDQIRWRRWKVRSMRSAKEGNLFPQEYISDLETCFIGPKDRVLADVDEQLAKLALNCRDPLRQAGILEIWREPEPGANYVFWVDPAGGEAIFNPVGESLSTGDPHDGVILKIHAGGIEHVASIFSYMEQKAVAEQIDQIGRYYNRAMLVVERNGVGRGVLNYLLNDFVYPNLYPERKADGELSGKWGWFTDKYNKGNMIGDAHEALREERVATYDRKLIRQLRALIYKDGKVMAKPPARDDRAMAFCGAITVAPQNVGIHKLAVGSYVTFDGRKKHARRSK